MGSSKHRINTMELSRYKTTVWGTAFTFNITETFSFLSSRNLSETKR